MRRVLISVLFIFISLYIHSQSEIEKVESTVQMNGVKAHMTFISSDELEGRDVGSRGIATAAMYIKTQLMSYGITTAPGLESYFQHVPLSTLNPPKKGTVNVGDLTFNFPEDFVILEGEKTKENSEFVFSNFAHEKKKPENVKGKIVISICGNGSSENVQSWFYQADEKITALKEEGAIGLIELYQSNKVPYKFLKQQFSKKQTSLDEKENDSFLHLWLNAGDKSKVAVLKEKGKINLDIDVPEFDIVKSKNVIGFIEGTDPILKNEYVVYSAHYDHVGIGNPDANQDSIFNGARDNGVGITAILEAARNLAQYPTRRSAIFVFFTAEEKGLLGSRYFVENSPVKLNDIVYNFNIDNGGYNDTSIVSVVGLERTTAEGNIQLACNAFGLQGIEDPAREQGLFDRSDNVNFAKKGIPAPTFSLGFRAFDAEIFKYYHQPADEVNTLDFDYLLKYFKAYVLASRKIANEDSKPFWKEGDKYYDAGIELYKE